MTVKTGPLSIAVGIQDLIPNTHEELKSKLNSLINSFCYSAPELSFHDFVLLNDFLMENVIKYRGEPWEKNIQLFINAQIPHK